MHSRPILVDIANLNSDASCLTSSRWLKALEGGTHSELYQILNSYVKHNAKLNLGIVGGTLADIINFNSECVDLINDNPQTFKMVIRPMVHSLSILWSDKTFETNFKIGRKLIKKTFNNVIDWYLPPEFAMRNRQVLILKNNNIQGTFVHPKRIKKSRIHLLPTDFYELKTITDESLSCIPFELKFDNYYLDLLHKFDSEIAFNDKPIVYGWRDAESPFFLPDSVEREAFFVEKSSAAFDRKFLDEMDYKINPEDEANIHSFPQNSLSPWLGNFKLYWLISEIKTVEKRLPKLSKLKQIIFFNLLSSDILSGIEKQDILIKIQDLKTKEEIEHFEINRVERNLEAEELLYLIESCDDLEIIEFLKKSENKFIKRVYNRLRFYEDYFKIKLNV